MLLAVGGGCGDDESTGAGAAGAGGAMGTGGGGGNGEGGTEAAKTYCDCMLLSCHDQYHATFGPETDEVAAREACLEQASAIPEAGMDVEMGNFIECRIHFCTAGADDESACPNTVGGVCTE